MTDKLARQKDVQGALSLGGATLGLSALGAKGASVAANRVMAQPKGKHSIPHAVPKWVTPQLARRLDKGSIGLVTLGAGVGGISGYNFAAIQRAEAKREREPVKKSAFGVVELRKREGDPSEYDKYNRAYAAGQRPKSLGPADPDDWMTQSAPQNPRATQKQIRRINVKQGGIDPERRRLRRLGRYQDTAVAGSIGAAATAGGVLAAPKVLTSAHRATRKAAQSASAKARPVVTSVPSEWARMGGTPQQSSVTPANADKYRKRARRLRSVDRRIVGAGRQMARVPKGKAAIGAGLASAALAGTAVGVNRYRKKNGRSYTDWWDG